MRKVLFVASYSCLILLGVTTSVVSVIPFTTRVVLCKHLCNCCFLAVCLTIFAGLISLAKKSFNSELPSESLMNDFKFKTSFHYHTRYHSPNHESLLLPPQLPLCCCSSRLSCCIPALSGKCSAFCLYQYCTISLIVIR